MDSIMDIYGETPENDFYKKRFLKAGCTSCTRGIVLLGIAWFTHQRNLPTQDSVSRIHTTIYASFLSLSYLLSEACSYDSTTYKCYVFG